MAGRQGWNAEKRVCPKGHPYTEANTYRTEEGGRKCRECRRAEDRRRWPGRRAYRKAWRDLNAA